MTPKELKDWMLKHNFSKAKAARNVGVARTTLDRYLAGAVPIPKLFELACEGFDIYIKEGNHYFD